MHATYPARYSDHRGVETTTIANDGSMLTMSLRGVEFSGSDFDGFAPGSEVDAANLPFSLWRGELCSYALECDIPVRIVSADEESGAILGMRLEIGAPHPTSGGVDREVLSLAMCRGGTTYRTTGEHGWFEDALAELGQRLPPGDRLKCCYTCAYSDYHPVGHGLFGGLACFRDNKAGYEGARDKHDLMRIWSTMSEFVQETHLCPEYSLRRPGAGYRG